MTWEELYATHADALYRYFLALTHHEDDALDLLHTAFLNLIVAGYDPSVHHAKEAIKLTGKRERGHDHKRRRRMDATAFGEDGLRPELEPSEGPTTGPRLDRDGQLERLREEIAKLPDRQREAITFHLAGASSAEIADHMGIGPDRVRHLKLEAAKNLRTALRDLEPGMELGAGEGHYGVEDDGQLAVHVLQGDETLEHRLPASPIRLHLDGTVRTRLRWPANTPEPEADATFVFLLRVARDRWLTSAPFALEGSERPNTFDLATFLGPPEQQDRTGDGVLLPTPRCRLLLLR